MIVIFFKIFFEFFKIGLFSVGGGLATFPFFYELSNKYPEFLDKNFLIDMIAISESTPGSIGINLATFVGFDITKNICKDSFCIPFFVSFLNTLVLVLPAFLVILVFVRFFDRFDKFLFLKDSFNFLFYLMIASIVLIISAILPLIKVSLIQNSSFNLKSFLFFLISCFALHFKKNNKFLLFPVFGFLGILLKM